MATFTIELDDEEYKELKNLAKKKGYENINELLKNEIELDIFKRKKLPEGFYKDASQKVKVEPLNRKELYDRAD